MRNTQNNKYDARHFLEIKYFINGNKISQLLYSDKHTILISDDITFTINKDFLITIIVVGRLCDWDLQYLCTFTAVRFCILLSFERKTSVKQKQFQHIKVQCKLIVLFNIPHLIFMMTYLFILEFLRHSFFFLIFKIIFVLKFIFWQIKYNKMSKTCHIKVEHDNPMGRKKSKSRQYSKRSTHSHSQEFGQNTKPIAKIYTQRTCQRSTWAMSFLFQSRWAHMCLAHLI